jgi:hypothetical protein
MGNFVTSASSSAVQPVSGINIKTNTANTIGLCIPLFILLFPIQTFLLFFG